MKRLYTETVQRQSQYQELRTKVKNTNKKVLILLRNFQDYCWPHFETKNNCPIAYSRSIMPHT